jgi:hypothetical protein
MPYLLQLGEVWRSWWRGPFWRILPPLDDQQILQIELEGSLYELPEQAVVCFQVFRLLALGA